MCSCKENLMFRQKGCIGLRERDVFQGSLIIQAQMMQQVEQYN